MTVVGAYVFDGSKEPFIDGGKSVIAWCLSYTLGNGSASEYKLAHPIQLSQRISLIGLK